MSKKNLDDKVEIQDNLITKLSCVVCGLSNLVHGQIIKGLGFLAIEVGYILFMISGGLQNVANFITLGTVETGWVEVPGKLLPVYKLGDNSMLFLLFGVLTLMITVGVVWAGYCSMKSARKLQKLDKEGKAIPAFVDDVKLMLDERFHITLLFVPICGILVFSVLPLVYMILVAFTNYDKDHQVPGHLFDWVGFSNLGSMLGGDARMSHTFIGVLIWTLIWAFFATFSNYFLGIIVALIINQKGIKFKKLWRSILVLTIAMPQFISLLVMRSFFSSYGVINRTLISMGVLDGLSGAIPFLTNEHWARVIIIVVNMWIGIPYTMLMSSGILMNIPQDLYEAATVDGANAVQMFFKITLPQIIFTTTPYLITTFVSNINNFNVIYLMTAGAPQTSEYYVAGKTDLLVTWLYTLTKNKMDYSLASTIGILIFVISATFSLLTYTRSKSYKEEDAFQ